MLCPALKTHLNPRRGAVKNWIHRQVEGLKEAPDPQPAPWLVRPCPDPTVQVAELMTQLMGAQHTIEEEAAARAALTEAASELAAAAAEQQSRAADLEAQLDELRDSLQEVRPTSSSEVRRNGEKGC